LIKKNEDQLLIPFYKGLNHFIINGNHKSTYLLRDFCYGV